MASFAIFLISLCYDFNADTDPLFDLLIEHTAPKYKTVPSRTRTPDRWCLFKQYPEKDKLYFLKNKILSKYEILIFEKFGAHTTKISKFENWQKSCCFLGGIDPSNNIFSEHLPYCSLLWFNVIFMMFSQSEKKLVFRFYSFWHYTWTMLRQASNKVTTEALGHEFACCFCELKEGRVQNITFGSKEVHFGILEAVTLITLEDGVVFWSD